MTSRPLQAPGLVYARLKRTCRREMARKPHMRTCRRCGTEPLTCARTTRHLAGCASWPPVLPPSAARFPELLVIPVATCGCVSAATRVTEEGRDAQERLRHVPGTDSVCTCSAPRPAKLHIQRSPVHPHCPVMACTLCDTRLGAPSGRSREFATTSPAVGARLRTPSTKRQRSVGPKGTEEAEAGVYS